MPAIRLIVALLLALAGAPLAAQTFPALTGRVVDDAHLLTPAQVIDLTSKSEALEAQTKRQFVIATVPSLQGRQIEEYGPLLGRAWGIGQKGQDNGAILLVAPTERRVFVATGYGAGGALTDAMSGEIIRNSILPYFKRTPPDYGGGIVAGADQIIKQLSLPPGEAQKNAAQAEQQQRARRGSSGGFIPVIFWIIVILWVIGSMARRVGGGRRYRSGGGGISPWVVLWGLNSLSRGSGGGSSWGGGDGGGFGGGGFGGGGGFSGGGGSFGGGGASGSW